MSFDYSTTGLPDKKEWKLAASICLAWLNQNMSMFGDDGIDRFMQHQPVTAAKRIMDNCDKWSDESITAALLGPAKGIIVADAAVEVMARRDFGDRAVDLIKTMGGMAEPTDQAMMRDANRLYMVESLSGMGDQIVGRARIDKHHEVRWNMVREFETNFEQVKGESPKLDAIFEESLKKSREALEKLDRDAAAKKGPKPNSPPGM